MRVFRGSGNHFFSQIIKLSNKEKMDLENETHYIQKLK
uniref:Uncharacterized protein n=1 Tax=Manihot esculenta TaxID=3983 RepID=A0A2C9W2S6_MANES